MTTFSTPPTDVVRLLSSYLPVSQLASLQSVSTALRHDLKNSRLRDQLLQWSLLFPGMLGSDFDENEMVLREVGVRTLDLTPGEKEALQLALDSLHVTPPTLDKEERKKLIARWLPDFAQSMSIDLTDCEIDYDSEEGKAYRYRTNFLETMMAYEDGKACDYLGLWDRRLFDSTSVSLTTVAMAETNFQRDGELEGFLRIFAVDGDRQQDEVAQSLSEWEQSPQSQFEMALYLTWDPTTRFTPRGLACRALAAMLIGMSRHSVKFKTDLPASAFHSPITIQILSVCSYPFLRGVDPITLRWVHVFEHECGRSDFGMGEPDCFEICSYLSNKSWKVADPQRLLAFSLILDRLIVQIGTDGIEKRAELSRFRAALMNRYPMVEAMRAHLQSRGVRLFPL